MHRSRETARSEYRAAASGLDQGHAAVPEDLVGDADPFVKADQVGAAAKENVLAVVDDLIGAGVKKRARPPAEIAAAFENSNAEAGAGQGACGGKAGYAAADDGDRGDGLARWRGV